MAECPTCGRDDFASQYGMKRHHTMTHGERLNDIELTCSGCGETFTRPEYDVVDADNYYCSQECRKDVGEHECPSCDYTSDSQFGIKQHHKRTHGESLTEIEVTCENCGETVTRQQSLVKQYEHDFCDDSCRTEWLSNELSERRTGENNPMFGQTGKDHHNWRGGYGQNYGEGWTDARRRTLERDGYECQDCGMNRETHRETFGYDLEIHHIQPFRTFSDAATANQLSNLITLCTTCHQKRENRT